MKSVDLNFNDMVMNAGPDLSGWQKRLQVWDDVDLGARIWQRDGRVWVETLAVGAQVPELTDRLDWLELPATMGGSVAELVSFVEEVVAAGFSRVVVLGMGGSSLIAEVWAKIFPLEPGFLPVKILDSTHPLSVVRIAESGELASTLFLVASKSGGTLETLSFFDYFYHQINALKSNPGDNFVALTDPGSKLETLAREKGFRKVFSTPAAVGGRFSALTFFGLLPAALQGVPIAEVLQAAQIIAKACAGNIPATQNPALKLGAFLGEMVLAGRDKLFLILSPSIKPFAVWLEQLIAESTGKSGFGLVPVIVEECDDLPLRDHNDSASGDSVYLFLRLENDGNRVFDQFLTRIQDSGEPFALIHLADRVDLGREIWRFEMATAAIGAALKINPFDQPDVEAAKIGARQAMAAWQKNGKLPDSAKLVDGGNLKISGSYHFSGVDDLDSALASFIGKAQPGDYIVVMVYLPQTESIGLVLQDLRRVLLSRCRVPVTLGFGPRFLHSTGQLHKGDANHGLFLQINGNLENDLQLPGSDYSFATLIAAQAQGDYEALLSRGRRIIALDWQSTDVESELAAIVEKLKYSLNLLT